MSSITKKHKIYFRKDNGEIRVLSKVAPTIFLKILDGFINGEMQKEYNIVNKNVEKWHQFKAIPFKVEKEQELEFKEITKKKKIILTYGGSHKELVELSMKGKYN